MTDDRPRTVVFGLDGAHFELLEPWIEAGELPNVERAIETGVSADLRSVLPPVTSPNWKAYATGKNPGKLGIYWWENVDVENRRVYYPEARKHRQTEFWELLSDAGGERPGVMGVPTTYPPKPVDEFLVAGAPDGRNDGYAHPPELEERLESEYDYSVVVSSTLSATPDRAAREIHEAMDARFRAARDLFGEYDLTFLQITTFYLNALQHYFWDGEHTLEGWKIVDEHLGEFLDEGHDVVLMSDHGATEIHTVFHVNAWLEREGYLTLDADAARLVYRLGINRERIIRLLSTLRIQPLAERLAPQALLDLVPDEQGELPRESKASNVDWDETDAIASGQGPIYLTTDPASQEYEAVRERLIDDLASLTGPDGEPLFEAVHRGEDVYHGEYLDDAPDVVVDQAPGVHVPGSVGRDEVFSEPADDGWRGENKRRGMFVGTGPSFDSGAVEELSILDLAPTLLHLRGHAVPADVDGTVRREVFAPDSDPAERSTEHRDADARATEKRRIRRAVRQLSI